MPYQIEAIVDAIPRGRSRGVKIDQYAEEKVLLENIPENKVARVAIAKADYRKFSAGVHAAAVRTGRVATCQFKSGAAWVSWVPLTDANRPKRRGAPRRAPA